MNAKSFLLGTLFGIIATLVVIAVFVVVLATKPLPEVATPPPASAKDIIVSVGEDYINQFTTEFAQKEEPAVQRVTVDLHTGGRLDMNVQTLVSLVGIKTDVVVNLIGSMQVDGQQLRYTIQKIELAGIGIPLNSLPTSLRSIIEAMQTRMNGRVNSMLEQNELVPVSVVTDEASITVSLRAK